jgi:hypothetical protein
VAAAIDPASWPDIADLSRVLVFLGCPHRSTGALDMEDRLSRFLFADYDAGVAKIRPSASSIAGLSASVIEINGLVRPSYSMIYLPFEMGGTPLRRQCSSSNPKSLCEADLSAYTAARAQLSLRSTR